MFKRIIVTALLSGALMITAPTAAHADKKGNDDRKEASHDSKGGDPSEWPEDLRVREFPEVRA